jgi:hypothetical protein
VAKREVLVDDLTGEVIVEGGQTVTLMVNDRSTQLDLGPDSAAKLEQAIAPFFKTEVPTASRNGRRSRRTELPTQPTAQSRQGLTEIRKWAKKNGYKVSERGRIPFAVMDAFTRAHMLTGATR